MALGARPGALGRGPWIPVSVPPAGGGVPDDRDGMHSDIGGLAHVLAEIRSARPWSAEESALAEGIARRVRAGIAGSTDYSYFDGLVSAVGVLSALGALRWHGSTPGGTSDRWQDRVMRFEDSARVDAPGHVVWETYTDVVSWPEWTASVTSVELLDPGPLRVGSRARIRQPRLPVAVWTVTEVDDGRSFTWVATGPGVRTTAVHRVDPDGDGCRVTATLDQAGLLGGVLGLLTAGLTRRYLALETAGLTARAEGC